MKFINLLKRKKNSIPYISLCGKLEAIIGGYYLSGSGLYDIETLYYDPDAGIYDEIPLSKDKIVAYFLENESIAIVRNDILSKLKAETKEYNLKFVSVENFEGEYLSKELLESYFSCLQNITWIDDDFMYDASIEFDFEAFEIIDSGALYLNPKHFSVEQFISVLRA
ncbi:hypothetical protein [Butyrivibrio sp. M55]|uniref:hypothetical protein n=1 Tax=Butyrivibrio sp. M55 TaxID=1855323 RepID=UPI0008E38FE8|nr:hypothetical protein [Butyrivibrio sp. M55]SFU94150.1 hypothetical protein SAMN05216540_12429 [Butyrivibrio sp. M55]